MRNECRFTIALALLIPLTGVSCSSNEPQNFPGQPVPAALTDGEALILARDYIRQNDLPTPGRITGEERHLNIWWFYYETAFDASARPPSLSYLIRVHDTGMVDHLH